MKKYETEFKLEVVQNFLAGEGGTKFLVRWVWRRNLNRACLQASTVAADAKKTLREEN